MFLPIARCTKSSTKTNKANPQKTDQLKFFRKSRINDNRKKAWNKTFLHIFLLIYETKYI